MASGKGHGFSMAIKNTDAPLSYNQGIGCLLQEVEAAGRAIIEIHLDPGHLNGESKVFREAMGRFISANDAVFRWKNAWVAVDGKLGGNPEEQTNAST